MPQYCGTPRKKVVSHLALLSSKHAHVHWLTKRTISSLSWDKNRSLSGLSLQLIDEVNFPLQTQDLPGSQAECGDGNNDENHLAFVSSLSSRRHFHRGFGNLGDERLCLRERTDRCPDFTSHLAAISH